MAWRAYEQDDPLDTQEMGLIDQYLQTDCVALWNVLDWMRQPKRKLCHASQAIRRTPITVLI